MIKLKAFAVALLLSLLVPNSSAWAVDTNPPSGTIKINGGAAATNNTSATLNLTATDDVGVTNVRFSNNGVAWQAWLPYSTPQSYTLPAGDGTKKVYAQFKDAAGNISTTVKDGIILDTVLPTGTVSIKGGAAATNTLVNAVTLSASGTGSSAAYVRFSNDGTTWASWLNYTTSKNYTLPAGDGTKTLYAQFKDAAGNLSTPVSDTIILDTVLPTGTVSIKGGAAATNTRVNTVTLSASGTGSSEAYVRFSNNGTTWQSWLNYTTSKNYTLPAGDGTKTLYAQFKDAAGNLSTPVSDTIILDTVLPTGTVSIKGGAAATNTRVNTVTLSASGTGSSAAYVRFSNDGTTWASWLNYTTSKNYTLPAGDGTKTLYAQFKDAAGNLSTPVSDTIILDTVLPTGTVSIKGGAAATNTRVNTVTLSASGTGSSEAYVRFSNNGTTWQSWLNYTISKNYTLPAGDGTKTLYAQFKDAAGNLSTPVNDTIILDTALPTGTVSINSGATYTNSLNNTAGLSSSGTGSDVTHVRLSEDGSTWGSWLTYASTKSFDFSGADGSKTIYAQFKDAAGNVSSSATDSITIDSAVPTGSIIINSGAATTDSTIVSLGLSASDATSGVTHMRFSNNNVSFSSWAAYGDSYSWDVTAGGGTKTVYAQFRDGAGNVSGSYSDTIELVSTYNVSGYIKTTYGSGIPDITVELDTSSPMSVTTGYDGRYEFSNVPPGSYTVTPSAPGKNGAAFSPSMSDISVTSSDVSVPDIRASISYTVSGTAYYSGPKTGRIYLRAEGSGLGTSIPSSGPFTIRGFTPGWYSIDAFIDYNGNQFKTAMTPNGSSEGFSVTDSDVTGVSIFITDPSSPAPAAPAVAAYQGLSSVFVGFEPERINEDPAADAFNIYYKTTPGVTKLNGTKIGPIKVSDNTFYLHGGLSNGTTYYYVVTSIVNGVESAISNEASATVGARTGARTVSGTITRTFTSTGPLYVGLYSPDTGIFYFTRAASPAASQAYSIPGVPDGDYFFAVIYDMNGSGSPDEGDVTNFSGNNMVTITGNLTKNATINNVVTSSKLSTSHGKFSYAEGEWYNLNFRIGSEGNSKSPVKATVVSGPNLPLPMDISYDGWNSFDLWVSNPLDIPVVGQTYTVEFTYADGTTGTGTPSVTGVLNKFATPVSPNGISAGLTPTFTWSAPSPAPPAPYYYGISLWSNNGHVWYTDNPMDSSTFSAPFNYDGSAWQTELTPGVQHYWNIWIEDQYGNKSENQMNFTPY